MGNDRRGPARRPLGTSTLLLVAAVFGTRGDGRLMAIERERSTGRTRQALTRKFERTQPPGSSGAAMLTDCNANGIPDDQDIDDCPGLPACDDCNLNDFPDSCDIAGGTSLDVNANGVPDECVFFDGGGGDEAWNNPGNWDDDEVPNNYDEVDDESVTVEGANVNLDLAVQVDTLRVLDGASFVVNGLGDEDFEIEEQGGMRVFSSTGLQSVVTIGDGRRLSVPLGTLEIESGGLLQGPSVPNSLVAAAGEEGPVQTRLEAATIRISSRCGDGIPGEMTLTSTMQAEVFGNLIVDGSQDCGMCAFCAAAAPVNVAGGETPPILRAKDSSVIDVAGDLILLGTVELTHTSSQPIYLGGSFVNASTCPECFTLNGPIVFLATPQPIAAGVPRTFELASMNYGPIEGGFVLNFCVGSVEIDAGTTVEFRDEFTNQPMAAEEVGYIDVLILRAGSTLTIVDRPVYFHTLINEGGAVVLTGRGSLRQVQGLQAIPTASTWSLIILVLGLLCFATIILKLRSGRSNLVWSA